MLVLRYELTQGTFFFASFMIYNTGVYIFMFYSPLLSVLSDVAESS